MCQQAQLGFGALVLEQRVGSIVVVPIMKSDWRKKNVWRRYLTAETCDCREPPLQRPLLLPVDAVSREVKVQTALAEGWVALPVGARGAAGKYFLEWRGTSGVALDAP